MLQDPLVMEVQSFSTSKESIKLHVEGKKFLDLFGHFMVALLTKISCFVHNKAIFASLCESVGQSPVISLAIPFPRSHLAT